MRLCVTFLAATLVAAVAMPASTSAVAWRPLPDAFVIQVEKGSPSIEVRRLVLWTGKAAASAPFTVAVDSASQRWISVSNSMGTMPASLSLRISPSQLAVGSHRARITISAPAGDPAEQDVPVTVVITDPDQYPVTHIAGRSDRLPDSARWPVLFNRMIAADSNGSVYVLEESADGTRRIAKVGPDGNTITIWRPDGSSGLKPGTLAVTRDGTVYFGDSTTRKVYRVTGEESVEAVAGGGTVLPGPEPIPAASAMVYPSRLAVDHSGNLYIYAGLQLLVMSPDGMLRVILGRSSGCRYNPADGAAAESTCFSSISGLGADAEGAVYLTSGDKLYRVSDGKIWIQASGLKSIQSMAVAANGVVYIANSANVSVVRRDGKVQRFAGQDEQAVMSGTWFNRHGGSALAAALMISSIAAGEEGTLYIADNYLYRVSPSGDLWVLAGYAGVQGPADDLWLPYVDAMAMDNDGSLLLANGPVLQRLDDSGTLQPLGVVTAIERIVGLSSSRSGDIVVATQSGVLRVGTDRPPMLLAGGGTRDAAEELEGTDVRLSVSDAAVLVDGSVVVLDDRHRFWRIDASRTLRLLGSPAFSATGRPRLAIGPDDVIYVSHANAVSALTAEGTLRTVAGGARMVTPRTGAAATEISISSTPAPVAFDAAGSLWILDQGRVIRVGPDGRIRVASNPSLGGTSVSVSPSGRIYYARVVLPASVGATTMDVVAPLSRVFALDPINFSCPATPGQPQVHVSSAGGTTVIKVRSVKDCQWVVEGETEWLTPIPSVPGGSAGTIEVTIAPNTAAAGRSSVVFVNGYPMAVGQAGAASAPSIGTMRVAMLGTAEPVAAPDSMVGIVAEGLADADYAVERGAAVFELAGFTVIVNGRLAPILWALTDYLAFLIPTQTEVGDARFSVQLYGVEIASGNIRIAPAVPSILVNGEEETGEADAYNTVTGAEPPFPVTTAVNPGDDKRTRIDVLTTGLRYADGRTPDGKPVNVASRLRIEAVDRDGAPLDVEVERLRPSVIYPGGDRMTIVLPPEADRTDQITIRVATGDLISYPATVAIRQTR